MDISLLTADNADKLKHLFDRSDKIVLCCHRSPDGDALGSVLGLAEYLRSCGKLPVAIIPDAYPDFLQWLPGTERLVRYDKHKDFADELIADADLLVCLDFNTASRTDTMAPAIEAATAAKILIDHHLSPDIKTDMCLSFPHASSTCELVFRVIWQLGGFDKIYRNVYNNYSEWRLRLMGHVLYNKLVVMPEQRSAYFTLTREDLHNFHYIKGDAEGLVNIPLQIKGMRLSISLRQDTERDNLIWVSLRSVDDFPCNLMAEQFFNGGGHLNAAGGRLECTVEEAEKRVKEAIEKFAKIHNP